MALVWHSWDDDAREAAALAGCVPLKANLLDKGPKDWQDEVMALCDCALGSLLAAQDMVKELLHTREVAWAHSTATGSVFVVQAPAESKAKTEVHIVHVLLWCEEEVRVFVGRNYFVFLFKVGGNPFLARRVAVQFRRNGFGESPPQLSSYRTQTALR